jgi:hypothetical protein
MAYQIILKKRFVSKLVKVLAYLEKNGHTKLLPPFLKKLTIAFSNYPDNLLPVYLPQQ